MIISIKKVEKTNKIHVELIAYGSNSREQTEIFSVEADELKAAIENK